MEHNIVNKKTYPNKNLMYSSFAKSLLSYALVFGVLIMVGKTRFDAFIFSQLYCFIFAMVAVILYSIKNLYLDKTIESAEYSHIESIKYVLFITYLTPSALLVYGIYSLFMR